MKLSTIVMAALLAGLATPALASDDDGPGYRERHGSRYSDNDDRRGDRDEHRAVRQSRAGWLSTAQITEKLKEQGLTVRRIEADHGRYEVRATDASGAYVKVYVDPTSGNVIRREGRS
jgi:hypothetical protein